MGSGTAFDASPLPYLQAMNHNPLDFGDNLPTPDLPTGVTKDDLKQTWWGFPTWRETLSPTWADPTVPVNVSGQPLGLSPLTAQEVSQGQVDNTGAAIGQTNMSYSCG